MKWKGVLLFLGLVLILVLAAGVGIGCSQGTCCQPAWLGDGLCDNACNDDAHNYGSGDCVVHDDSYLNFTNGGLTLSAATYESGGKKTTTMTDASGQILLTSELTTTGVKLTFPGVTDPTYITFPEPLDELPTNYTASMLATFISGQIELSETGVMQDSPGCDWFYDEPCTLSCCAHHDKCYYDYDCSALSWVAFVGSDECKACNYVASHCIVNGCQGVTSPTYSGPEVGTCYDRKCDQFYSCSTLVGGQAGKMNCQCTPPPCATLTAATLTTSDYCALGCSRYLIGDGTCDSECNVESCNYDGGDCNRCSTECTRYLLGDGKCDHHCYDAACNWDNGDCATLYNECALGCPSVWVGDTTCDSTCNNAACDWDGGDCSATPTQTGYCASGCPASWINNNNCDNVCYTAACNYDGTDCDYLECSTGCPTSWVGDKECDGTCNNAACNWDGGDCSGGYATPYPTQYEGGSATPSPTQSGCFCEIGDTECFNAPCNN